MGSARANASALPPAMKVSVAAFAPPTPPDTGASSAWQPRSFARAWALRALSTSMVEQSMARLPGFTAGRMSLHTESTCLPAGSMVTTASASATASRNEPAIPTPVSRAASQPAGARAKPAAMCPALTRLAAIGPPMWPRPIKAIVVMARSLHRRDHELRAFLDGAPPPRGHGFGLGVEAHRVGPMLVEIAEAGALPAAEGIVSDRHRDGHVHADHADIDLGGEVARRVPIAGVDSDAVAVFVLVRQAQRLVVVPGAHHREHRSEDFLLVDAHLGPDLVKEAATHVETVLVALHAEVAPVHDELRALLHPEIDVRPHLVEMRLGDERAEVGGGVGRGANFQAFHPRRELVHKGVGG